MGPVITAALPAYAISGLAFLFGAGWLTSLLILMTTGPVLLMVLALRHAGPTHMDRSQSPHMVRDTAA